MKILVKVHLRKGEVLMWTFGTMSKWSLVIKVQDYPATQPPSVKVLGQRTSIKIVFNHCFQPIFHRHVLEHSQNYLVFLSLCLSVWCCRKAVVVLKMLPLSGIAHTRLSWYKTTRYSCVKMWWVWGGPPKGNALLHFSGGGGQPDSFPFFGVGQYFTFYRLRWRSPVTTTGSVLVAKALPTPLTRPHQKLCMYIFWEK